MQISREVIVNIRCDKHADKAKATTRLQSIGIWLDQEMKLVQEKKVLIPSR